MGDFDAGANYYRAQNQMKEEVHKRILDLLDNFRGILNPSTETFVKQSISFLKEMGLDDGNLTELRMKMGAVQDKERLIWEIRVPEGVHYCEDCTTDENYPNKGCHMCDHSGESGGFRKYCKLGHTTVCIVRDQGGHNKGVMIGDHFRTALGRPTK